MKKLIALLSLLAFTVQAATLTLTWDNNPASENITGYSVWASLNGGTTNRLMTVATNSAVLPALASGTYTFLVSATNALAESPKSVPITQFLGAPGTPVNFKLTITLP